MAMRGSSLRLLEQPNTESQAPGPTPTPIESPCSVCGAESLAPWPDDTGRPFCLDHYPTEDPQEFKLRQQWTADPRSDLRPDSAHWLRLLSLAWAIDGKESGGLFGTLHGCRCGGAKLLPVPPDKMRLTRGEWSEAEWAMVREGWLMPYAKTLTELLERVRGSDA